MLPSTRAVQARTQEDWQRLDAPDGSLIGTRIVKRSETNHGVDYLRACFAPGRRFVDVVESERRRFCKPLIS
jgi:hypothetical protein